MPADFLMPLFVLTLLANAALVAVAIRAMRHGHFDPDRPSPGGDRPPTWPRSGSEPHGIAAPGSDVVSPAIPHGIPRAITEPTPAVEPGPVSVEPLPVVDPAPAVEQTGPTDRLERRPTRPGSAARRRRPATGAAPDPAPDPMTERRPDPHGSRPASTKRGRRRFSLPNLDDDHEKVSRSIETFLGGVEAVGGDGSTPVEDGAAGSADAGGATTVVLVAVAGLPAAAGPMASLSAARTVRGRAVESGAVADALALVERTLRNAVRGTDVVTGDGRGRFRIVMASTGELAARAYLRRVRTTIEPGLEAAGAPLRLVVATATVLDEPVEIAIRHATDRLAAALDAAAAARRDTRSAKPDDRSDDASISPRAAAD